MEDHEQLKLTFCFLGGEKINFGDLVHLLRKKLSLLIYWDCLSTTEMTHAYPEGFRWHHKFTAGHHGPCPEQTEVKKKIIPVDSSAKPTLHWVHFVPTEINRRCCFVYQRTIKRWHLIGLSAVKHQHKVTSSHQWQLHALTFPYLFTIIFSKRCPERGDIHV